MEIDAFKEMVLTEGFSEPLEVVRDANFFIDVHKHPFEAKALILKGQIEIGLGESSSRFLPGDVFHLSKEEPHWERYGPEGVVYLSARKST
jgi:quercetin dioxygenase-like cupin family protein